MIDLRHIRHFLAVASHSTVQAAADALHITQPALTKSIARFEDDIGEALFDRRGRKLVLTELGERLVERGTRLLQHVRELEEEVALWQGLGTGEIAIGVDPETELSLLPSVLEQFVPAHPGVQLTVQSGHTQTLFPALLRGDLHFLVSDAEIALEREEFEIQPLATDPLAAALRKGHPLANKRKPSLDELACFPLAGASTAPRFERWSASVAARDGVAEQRASLVCDNYEVLARLAEQTDTILFGPQSLLGSYAQLGRLKLMKWPLEGPESSPSVIRTKGRPLSPAAEHLMALFLA